MNGRVYDPALGRFVSADPYITTIYDAQNLNRYSYVNNRPFSYTDPSGYAVVAKPIDGNLNGTDAIEVVVVTATRRYVTTGSPHGDTGGFGSSGAGGSSSGERGENGKVFEVMVEKGRLTKPAPPSLPRIYVVMTLDFRVAGGSPANASEKKEQNRDEKTAAKEKKCGPAITGAVGLGANLAALFGIQGDLRVGITSNLQLFFTASGGGSGGLQGGAAASVFLSTGFQRRAFPTRLSKGSSVGVLVQGVGGLGGGEQVQADLSGLTFSSDTKASVGAFFAPGAIVTNNSITAATPAPFCDNN
jgi:hypothetical protein